MTAIGGLMAFLLLSNAVLGASPAHANAPVAPASPSYAVTLTAYNAVPEQTSNHPLVTASGAYSNPEVVAARSQDLGRELPFGTIIEIVGPSTVHNPCGYDIVAPLIGYRVIADTMNARYTNRIDILFNTKSNYLMADGSTKNASTILGVCAGSSIRVVGHIDLTDPSRLPKTQEELAALVNGKELALK
ncbi:3D domain-containing protein [Candidatus Parcubacteria bacterium]|nr:3D domain-containing protein [Candidatus Parcubacteria bacterium]